MGLFEQLSLVSYPFEWMGGLLIGFSATLLWLTLGRISGMTGVLSSLFLLRTESGGRRFWALWFLAGLVAAYPLYLVIQESMHWPALEMEMTDQAWLWALAGLLVGFGTYIGNGCTSGHGVCGMGRLSLRSIVATITFMATAILTVLLMNLVSGGAA
jgi:uncharacterized membrane protein YedE/YeeE